MATYYASPTNAAKRPVGQPAGNDSNNGLSAALPKTIQGAFDAAVTGDTVILLDGRYGADKQFTGAGAPDTKYSGPITNVGEGNGGFAAALQKNGVIVRPQNMPVPATSIYPSGNPCSTRWTHFVEIELLRVNGNNNDFAGLKVLNPYWPVATGRWVDTPLAQLIVATGKDSGFWGFLTVTGTGNTFDQMTYESKYRGNANPTTYPSGYGFEGTDFDWSNPDPTGVTIKHQSVYDEVRSMSIWHRPNTTTGNPNKVSWTVGGTGVTADAEIFHAVSVGGQQLAGFGNTRNGIDPAGIAAAVSANSGYNPFSYCGAGVYVLSPNSSDSSGNKFYRSLIKNTRLGILYLDPAARSNQIFFDQIELLGTYGDVVTVGGAQYAANLPEELDLRRFLVEAPWAMALDLGGAHPDCFQIAHGGAKTGITYLDRVRNIRNFIYQPANMRADGSQQSFFMAVNAAHNRQNDVQIARNPYAAEIITACTSAVGLAYNGIQNGYVDRVVTISGLGFAGHGSFAKSPNIQLGQMKGGIGVGNDAENNSSITRIDSGTSAVLRSISDAPIGYSDGDSVQADYQAIQFAALGKQGTTVPYSTVFKGSDGSGSFVNPGSWTIAQMFGALQTKDLNAYGGLDTSLEAFMETPINFASHRKWAKWKQQIGVAPGSTVTFQGSQFCGGGNIKDVVTVTGDANTQIQITSMEGTVLTPWTANGGTATMRRAWDLVQIRGTATSTPGLLTTFGATIDGVRFTATSQTSSGNAFPRAVCNGTATTGTSLRLADAGAGLGAGTDSPYMTLFISVIPSAADLGVSRPMFQHHTGSIGPGLISMNSSVANVSSRWNVNLRNQANTVIASHGVFGSLLDTAGRVETLAVCVDMTKASVTDGLKMFQVDAAGNWNRSNPPGTTWLGNAGHNIAWSKTQASTFFYLLCDTGTTRFGGQLLCFWLSNEYVDLDDPVMRNRFTADGIGYDGDGVIAGVRPLIFFPGKASILNTLTNLGRATNVVSKTTGSTASFTAGTPDIWPVPLSLVSEVLTPGPYLKGQPIDFLIYPTGGNVALNVTGAVTGVAGAWAQNPKPMGDSANLTNGIVMTFTPSAAGAATVDFSDNAVPDYVNPNSIALTIEEPPAQVISNSSLGTLGLGGGFGGFGFS